MTVWRLSTVKFAASLFSGEGARLFGGRWSPVGLPVVYCAESRSLAVVEILTGLDETDRLFEQAWMFAPAEIPDECIEKPTRVPDYWRQYPHAPSTQTFCTEWLQAGRSPVLRVPSAVVPGEFNYLLNPAHSDFMRVKIGKAEHFSFDPRLRGSDG